ncbi:hypothetical protein CPC08DRAFT_750067 [Agrocybe pediades]|nr:hypothetical protein CPC08DRAFT_750067 [Agrocybe pediades]
MYMESNGRLYARGNQLTSSRKLTEDDLPPILLASLVESLLYGVHVVMFCLCARILWKRWQGRLLQVLMLGAVVTMFLFATTDVALSWNLVIRHTRMLYTADMTTLYKTIYPKFAIHLVNNAIAATLLIVRCYVVWGKQKVVLISGGILLLLGTLSGMVCTAATMSPLTKKIGAFGVAAMGIVLNIGITALTIGRILWIARKVKLCVGREMVSHYQFAVGILIESGLLYTVAFILTISLASTNLLFILPADGGRYGHTYGAPLLLVVQIAMGQTTKSVDEIVSRSLRMSTAPVILDTIGSVGVEDGRDRSIHMSPVVEDIRRGASS